MKITLEQIEELASRPEIKRIAVENFLRSLSDNRIDDLLNLGIDRNMYKWNFETINTILDAIILAYKEEKWKNFMINIEHY